MISPVIMCGGSGSRLWPMSSKGYPKQFLKFFNNDKSLLQLTVLRFLNKDGFSSPVFLTNIAYVDLLKNQLLEIGINDPEIIIEPSSRNNAPAIAVAAYYFNKWKPNETMFIMPSDAYIEDYEIFLKASYDAFNYLKTKDHFVLFGIKPTYAETGFGYIKAKKDDKSPIKKIEAFFEKPTLEKAEAYIKEGYLWNSGMFMVNPKLYIEELNKYQSELNDVCYKAYNNAVLQNKVLFINEEFYGKAKSISIDYAIIEKTHSSSIIEIEKTSWADIGSWKAVYQLSKKDADGNVFIGNVKALNCKNCYVYSNGALITVCDISNQVIINIDNLFLNVSLEATQDVKLLI